MDDCFDMERKFRVRIMRLVIAFGAGWYFMCPPVAGHDRNKILSDAPISQWYQYAAFDSAAECEKFKQFAPNEMKRRLSQHDGKLDPKVQKDSDTLIEVLQNGLCVATDDPRLKEN